MAKTKISEFSATPGNNTDIDGINIAEGCAPSGINDAIRELMSQLKDFQAGTAGDSFNGPVGTTTAAAGAFTTLITSSTVTHNGGTANGVAYLNGSKVLTTGSALTFDGSALTITSGSLNLGAGGANGFISGNTWYGINTGDWNFQAGNGSQQFAWKNSSGGDWMRLTSTGLGIGTSSPNQKLAIAAGSGAGAAIEMAGNGNTLGSTSFYVGQGSGGDAYVYQRNATQPLVFGTNNTERMRLDSSGNLGLGVTPSAWTSVTPVFQVNRASFYGYSNEARMSANYYYNAGDKYIASDYATSYSQANGQHVWYTAPSGTAGNAITFTQAATLTADGDFLVGTTTSFARLSVIVPGGANRNLIQAGVTSATDGLTVKWNHATSTIRMNIQNLPTSSTGLAAGDLWNDGGTLKIA